MLAGQLTAGASQSLTVTLKPHEVELPELSVTVQETGVVPLANVEPLAGTQVARMVPSMSSVPLTPP